MKLKKSTKALVLALGLVAGLASCNSKKDEQKSSESSSSQVTSESKSNEKSTDKNSNEKSASVSDEASTSNSTKAFADMTNDEKIKTLEDVIFENRVRARASELLIENNPTSVEPFRDELDQLLETSEQLNEEANEALEKLKAN